MTNNVYDAAIEYCGGNKGVDARVRAGFIMGANWQKRNLWNDAQGDNLPDYDREVVVLLGKWNGVDLGRNMRVAFGHRPDPNGWDGKSLTTGKHEHYDVKTYDKGGWSIPDVKFWLDAPLPGIE